MKIHNLPAKHMHKANNRGCFHEEKRDKLLSDAVNKGLDESPKIAKIVEMTGCSRGQALKLLEELE